MTFDPFSLQAPAKINRFLHITGRRPDGYHELQTLFQLLDKGDCLHFLPRDDNQVRLDTEHADLATEDNLILRAARLLQPHRHRPIGVTIHLEKNLPMGGGLGGGSSDAATALVALNHLWRCGFTKTGLQELSLQLGADVPLFVGGQSAWAEGVGEKLTPMTLPSQWFLVLTPRCHVSTRRIFSHKELTRDTPNITVRTFLEQGGGNDCQALVRKLYPPVDEALTWLKTLIPQAQMSGTGACVFAAVDSAQEAQQILDQAPDHLRGFVARGVNQSPVYELVSGEQ